MYTNTFLQCKHKFKMPVQMKRKVCGFFYNDLAKGYKWSHPLAWPCLVLHGPALLCMRITCSAVLRVLLFNSTCIFFPTQSSKLRGEQEKEKEKTIRTYRFNELPQFTVRHSVLGNWSALHVKHSYEHVQDIRIKLLCSRHRNQTGTREYRKRSKTPHEPSQRTCWKHRYIEQWSV